MKKRSGTKPKGIILYNVGRPDARLFSLDECRDVGMVEFGKRIAAGRRTQRARSLRKRILGVIDTLRTIDDAEKYRMVARLYGARREGRKNRDVFISALTLHLLLNPLLLPGLAAGIGHERGTPAKAKVRAAA